MAEQLGRWKKMTRDIQCALLQETIQELPRFAAIERTPISACEDLVCSICGESTRPGQAFFLHMYHHHGYSAPEKAFSNEFGKCCICLKIFHNQTNLNAHLAGRMNRGSRCPSQPGCVRALVILCDGAPAKDLIAAAKTWAAVQRPSLECASGRWGASIEWGPAGSLHKKGLGETAGLSGPSAPTLI